MKRKLLASLFFVLFAIAIAQAQYKTTIDPATVTVKVEYQKAVDKVVDFYLPPAMPHKDYSLAVDETEIGGTVYDLQSNTLLGNRIHMFQDGSMGAIWTMGISATAFPGRGTGYNFFDGTSWGSAPTARIESLRTGWPSYAPLGIDGELVVSHDFAASELYYLTRDTKGTGAWSETLFSYSSGPSTLSWARATTSGSDNNYIHMVANSVNEYEGMASALVYSRSEDAGASWDIENTILDGMTSTEYLDIGADEYVWAEQKNGTIALLVGGAWHDLFMMKSDDNGDSWDKTVIWEHPYPLFDWDVTITDTFFCCDNSASICLDNDGNAHVVFGISRVAHFDVGNTYNYWPYYDGVGYWNETMPAFSGDIHSLAPPQYGYAASEMVEDVNYIGWMQDVDGSGTIDLNTDIMAYRELGPSTMPSIYVDENDFIYVFFASTTETYVFDVYNYKHIWARAYADGAWTDFMDLTNDITHIFDECVYPQLTQYSNDDYLHYIYNADVTPGLALDEDHGYQDNRTIYGKLPKSDLIIGFGQKELEVPSENVQVSQNFPNPVKSATMIKVTLESSCNLNLEVTNLLGQLVISEELGEFTAGSHDLSINLKGQEAGIYFYTVSDGKTSITKRLIKE